MPQPPSRILSIAESNQARQNLLTLQPGTEEEADSEELITWTTETYQRVGNEICTKLIALAKADKENDYSQVAPAAYYIATYEALATVNRPRNLDVVAERALRRLWVADDYDLCQRANSTNPETRRIAGNQFIARFEPQIRETIDSIWDQIAETGGGDVVDKEDLFQTCMLHYFNKTTEYAPDERERFSVFAGSDLSGRIARIVAYDRYGLELDTLLLDILDTLHQVNTTRLESGGQPLSEEEVAATFNLPTGPLDLTSRMTTGNISRAKALLDMVSHSALDGEQLSLAASAGSYCIEDEIITEILVNQMLRTLSQREQEFVRHRYGVGLPEFTRSEISTKFGVTEGATTRTINQALLALCMKLKA